MTPAVLRGAVGKSINRTVTKAGLMAYGLFLESVSGMLFAELHHISGLFIIVAGSGVN